MSPGLPRILVVDDSRMVRASIAKHLKGHFDLREETDGEAGWEALQSDSAIRMLISDLGMPRLDGFGLLERIRSSRDPRIRNIPAVIISGDEDEVSRHRARNLGASDFITKGISALDLVSCCERLVAESTPAAALGDLEMDGGADPFLPFKQFLNLGQESLAKSANLAVLVFALDGLKLVRAAHGDGIVKVLIRRLGPSLRAHIRSEDALTHLVEGCFAILAQGTDSASAMSFGAGLKRAVEKLALNVKGNPIHLGLTVGVAHADSDHSGSFAALFETAKQRLESGLGQGGGCVLGPESHAAASLPDMDLAQALKVLSEGNEAAVKPHLAELMRSLMPLLDLASRELHIPMLNGALAAAMEKIDNGVASSAMPSKPSPAPARDRRRP